MKRKLFLIGVALSIVVLVLAAINTTAQSNIPQDDVNLREAAGSAFTYQGQLKNGDTPVDDSCDFKFSLFDAASDGSQIGSTQTASDIAVNDGLFTVNLDFGSTAFNGDARWLEIQVRCPAGSGDYTKLSPLHELAPVPYALSLVPGAIVSGTTPNEAVISGISHATSGWSVGMYGESNVGAGVYGYSSANGTGVNGTSTTGDGVWGESTGSGNAGVKGVNYSVHGNADGVHGESHSPDGSGVAGHNKATTGDSKGVYGDTASPSGMGVYGAVITNTVIGESRGVYGVNYATSGSGDGVTGKTYSPEGSGVTGRNKAATGDAKGVYGETTSPSGSGVFGIAITTTSGSGSAGVTGINLTNSGVGNGVYGEANTPNGAGVLGVNNSTTGSANAVKGVSSGGSAVVGWNEADGIGIQGHSITGTGVMAESVHGRPIEAYGSDIGDVEFYVSNEGDVYADGTYESPAADFAEMLPAHEGLEQGDVLIIGQDGKLTRSTQTYQTAVVGVYSTHPGFVGGASEGAIPTDTVPLAIVGVVPVKASAENGHIQPGDPLTTAPTPGHAMRAEPITLDGISFYPSGVVIGKALEPLESGTGIIKMLVMLQ